MAFYDTSVLLDFFDPDSISERTLDAEEVIFRFGDPVSRIYFVVQGEVQAVNYLENGQLVVFYRARAGQALGEESMHLENHHYTGIVGLPDTVVRSVSKDSLKEVLLHQPKALSILNSCLAYRYADALMYRELLSERSATKRLITWLQWQIRPEKDGSSIKSLYLEGRMGSLGADLGLTKESIYRALKSLEDSGEITRKDGKIYLTLMPK